MSTEIPPVKAPCVRMCPACVPRRTARTCKRMLTRDTHRPTKRLLAARITNPTLFSVSGRVGFQSDREGAIRWDRPACPTRRGGERVDLPGDLVPLRVHDPDVAEDVIEGASLIGGHLPHLAAGLSRPRRRPNACAAADARSHCWCPSAAEGTGRRGAAPGRPCAAPPTPRWPPTVQHRARRSPR